MARINVTLDINSDGNGVLEEINTTQSTNNVSKHPNTNIIPVVDSNPEMEKYEGHLGIPIYGTIGNYIGTTRLLEDGGYDGYMYGITNASGNYSLEISLTGYNLFQLTFYFDDMAEQYPTHYTVTYLDGSTKEYTNSTNESKISILFQSGQGTQKVLFDQWTKANYNVALTYIEAIPATLVMGKSWIKSLSSESQSVSNPATIEYGCLASNGSLYIQDMSSKDSSKSGILFTYAKYGYLDTNMFNLKMFMNGEEIQYHIPTESPYFADDNSIQMSLSNQITKWRDLQYSGKTFVSGTNLYTILSDVMIDCLGLTSTEDSTAQQQVDNMLQTTIRVDNDVDYDCYKDMTVKAYLMTIIMPNEFTLESDNLTNIVNAICTVAQLNCYQDDDGTYKFINARPIANGTEDNESKVIEIPYNVQNGNPQSTILVSNRYDSVIIN